MPIDPSLVGTRLPEFVVNVERGRLRLFAEATGQDDPVYSDLAAARAAGHRDLPIPPTFFMSLELERPDPFGWLIAAGADLRRILHGEQCFTYHAMAYAGDALTVAAHITDVYSKKGGALEFLVRQTGISRRDQPIATLEQTIVVRHVQEAR
jgi:hypothetical protein